MLKGRWRILKRLLNMKTPGSCARTIVACMVLHNLTVNSADDFSILDRVDPWVGCHQSEAPELYAELTNRAVALTRRDNLKDYLVLNDQ